MRRSSVDVPSFRTSENLSIMTTKRRPVRAPMSSGKPSVVSRLPEGPVAA